jgi:hypothetical protein
MPGRGIEAISGKDHLNPVCKKHLFASIVLGRFFYYAGHDKVPEPFANPDHPITFSISKPYLNRIFTV